MGRFRIFRDKILFSVAVRAAATAVMETASATSKLDGERAQSIMPCLHSHPLAHGYTGPAGAARPVFPFTAIVGQEEMKLALILNVIDPKIGGVMVMGDRGTGKSTTIRALADLLPEMKVWTMHIPVANASVHEQQSEVDNYL